MTTIKTCTIPDEYKHVVFKDLENYIKFEDLYDHKFTQDEKRALIANLGIDEVTQIEDSIKAYSKNPVSSEALYKELKNKADWKALEQTIQDVRKLKGWTPKGLLIQQGNKVAYYDTRADVKIVLPTSLSQFENDLMELPSPHTWYYASSNGDKYSIYFPDHTDIRNLYNNVGGPINALTANGERISLRLNKVGDTVSNVIFINGVQYSASAVGPIPSEESVNGICVTKREQI